MKSTSRSLTTSGRNSNSDRVLVQAPKGRKIVGSLEGSLISSPSGVPISVNDFPAIRRSALRSYVVQRIIRAGNREH